MKVYLVMDDNGYEGQSVRLVCAKREDAEHAARMMELSEDDIAEWDVEDASSWPQGRPFRLTVYEAPRPTLPTSSGWNYGDFRDRDTGWSFRTNDGIYREYRVWSRCVWLPSRDEAIAMVQAKESEVRALPFNRVVP